MENPFENMKPLLAIILLCTALNGAAQNYHAVQGSSYSGSLGIANNPASMLNTPYKWDVTVFGFQLKNATNIFTIHDYSLLSSPRNSSYGLDSGEYARREMLGFNVNLLNARITLDRRQAIGFGINVRGYVRAKTAKYSFIDTLVNTADFLNINQANQPLDAQITGSTWVEIFGSYSRTIMETAKGRLNTGITLRASRGIAGAFLNIENIRFTRESFSNRQQNVLANARAQYGYSANFDRWTKERKAGQNIRDLVTYSEGGIGVDVGVEYLIKTQEVPTYEDDDYYDYNWKLSLSLLDAGINQYKYGRESRTLSGIRADMIDTVLDDKFRNAGNFAQVNDTLATVVQNISTPRGNFTVLNPTRIVLNADRFLRDDFYINGEISFNVSSIFKKYHHVSELNFITITPRWETRKWGVYLPLQYNAAGKFWIGGAFKAGPLLLGVHNWGNMFSKKSMQNGGGYLALVIRSWTDSWIRRDRRLNCPD